MRHSIFSKEDLKFCDVPLPDINAHKEGEFDYTAQQISDYETYQDQGHPSIVYAKDGWNGHKYWLATTPLPAGSTVFENPCIYYGDEDEDGTPATIFTPISGTASGEYVMTSNPIVKVSNNTQVNSDPDIALIGDVMYMLCRKNYYPDGSYVQKSLTGQAWTKRGETPIIAYPVPNCSDTFISPAIVHKNGEIYVYGLIGGSSGTFDIDNNDGVTWGLQIVKGTTFENGGDLEYYAKGHILGNRFITPWHMDIFTDEVTGKYYMILCGHKTEMGESEMYAYLAESDDGITFNLFGLPLTTAFENYRPTAFIREDRSLVIYFNCYGADNVPASVLPNGVKTGNRYIVMATKNFDDVLAELKAAKWTNA